MLSYIPSRHRIQSTKMYKLKIISLIIISLSLISCSKNENLVNADEISSVTIATSFSATPVEYELNDYDSKIVVEYINKTKKIKGHDYILPTGGSYEIEIHMINGSTKTFRFIPSNKPLLFCENDCYALEDPNSPFDDIVKKYGANF